MTLTGSIWLKLEEVARTCECVDEHWALLKAGNFLTGYPVEKDSAP